MARLYDSAKWRRMRSWQLQTEPLCRMCAEAGQLESATVVDHIVPHRNEPALFYDSGNLQSLCRDCHDRRKQSQERSGFGKALGADGWPADQAHPANTGQQPKRWDPNAWTPPNIPRMTLPVTLVSGPPAAGKTTWCREHATADTTLVLDPDFTAQALSLPEAWAEASSKHSRRRIAQYELSMLREAETLGYRQVFVVRSAPRRITRIRWLEALGPKAREQLILTASQVCVDRILADPARRAHAARQIAAVKAWWREYRR